MIGQMRSTQHYIQVWETVISLLIGHSVSVIIWYIDDIGPTSENFENINHNKTRLPSYKFEYSRDISHIKASGPGYVPKYEHKYSTEPFKPQTELVAADSPVVEEQPKPEPEVVEEPVVKPEPEINEEYMDILNKEHVCKNSLSFDTIIACINDPQLDPNQIQIVSSMQFEQKVKPYQSKSVPKHGAKIKDVSFNTDLSNNDQELQPVVFDPKPKLVRPLKIKKKCRSK